MLHYSTIFNIVNRQQNETHGSIKAVRFAQIFKMLKGGVIMPFAVRKKQMEKNPF